MNKNSVTIDIPESALVRPQAAKTTATIDSYYDPDMTILHPNHLDAYQTGYRRDVSPIPE